MPAPIGVASIAATSIGVGTAPVAPDRGGAPASDGTVRAPPGGISLRELVGKYLPISSPWQDVTTPRTGSTIGAEHVLVGTTVRYRWRDRDGLATVVEKTDRYVRFDGPDCGGRFNHDQIDRLVDEGRLEVVLDDETYAEPPWWVEAGDA